MHLGALVFMSLMNENRIDAIVTVVVKIRFFCNEVANDNERPLELATLRRNQGSLSSDYDYADGRKAS